MQRETGLTTRVRCVFLNTSGRKGLKLWNFNWNQNEKQEWNADVKYLAGCETLQVFIVYLSRRDI